MANGDNPLPGLPQWAQTLTPAPDATTAPQAPPQQLPTPVSSNQLPSPGASATPMSPDVTSGPMPGVLSTGDYTQPANRGGVVKNILTRMFYGMGQAGLAHVGLPTDYDMQRTAFQQSLQQNELALKRAQQAYQQSTVTFQDPRTGMIYQGSPAAMQRVPAAALTGQTQTDVQLLRNQGNFTIAQMKALLAAQMVKAYKDSVDENGKPGVQMLNEFGQPMGFVPGAVAKSLMATATTSQQHVIDNEGNVHVYTVVGGRRPILPAGQAQPSGPVPALTAPEDQVAPSPPPAGTAPAPAVPSIPPAVRQRFPQGSPAQRAIGGGGGPIAQVVRTPGGAPLQTAAANKWVMGTEPNTGRTIAVPAGQAQQFGIADPAELSGSDLTAMHEARQAYQTFARTGDPNKPETQGVIQLINSLAKDNKLGLLASRFNNFWVNDVGASPGDDPRIISLLDQNHLGATKVMLAHIGKARAPETIQSFLNLADAGKMDGPTLLQGTKTLAEYMRNAGYMPTSMPAAGATPVQTAPSQAVQDLLRKWAPK